MDIWISTCHKKSKCSHCGEDIENNEPCVFGKLWKKFTGKESEVRKWTITFHWHARRKSDGQCCWLAQAMEYLEKQEYTEMRGRHCIVLPKELREKRLSILRRRARVMQRIRAEMEEGGNVDALIHLGKQLETLKEEIAPLGGVPKNWE